MQTVVLVICNRARSLREVIARDKKLTTFGLRVVQSKRTHRKPGWAKLISTKKHPGAINVVWDKASQTLICRAVTKNRNNPCYTIGDFLAYLLARHSGRIGAVVMSRMR